MRINIEPNNGMPIYEQLVRQVKYSVAEGTLVPGQVIPSVREMAKKLTVNPNTVQRAYLQLQSEKVLQALRGRGMAVADGAIQICESDRSDLLESRLKGVVEEILRSGIDESRLKKMFNAVLADCKSNPIDTSAITEPQSGTSN